MLDGLFDKSLDQLRFLEAYIVAGGERLDEEKRTHLVELEQKARSTGDGAAGQIAAQQFNDFRQALDRLERKLHDLKLSRVMALQTLPQIRLIQNRQRRVDRKATKLADADDPGLEAADDGRAGAVQPVRGSGPATQGVETTNEILRKMPNSSAPAQPGSSARCSAASSMSRPSRRCSATSPRPSTRCWRSSRPRQAAAAEQKMQEIERELKATLVQAQARG